MPRHRPKKKDVTIQELRKYWNDINFQGRHSKTTLTRQGNMSTGGR